MNQPNLKAYLDLIQGLLSCPQGEEWILLKQNEELVNSQLVEIMEQVAHYLATEGNIKAAKYLHNWAGKLYHIMSENVPASSNKQDKTQDYIELIQALIDCPEGQEESILAAHQSSVDPQLVKLMQQVAHQMAAEGNESTASFLSNLAADLNRNWLQKHEFQPTFKKEIAPDPWLEEDATVTQTPPADTSLANSATQTDKTAEAAEKTAIAASSSQTTQAPQTPQSVAIAQQSLLKEIAAALVGLESTLASRMQSFNPLWYMEVLEKAETANWILTTEEVERLIGIKPHCHHDETTYYRGCWAFIKAGKIGTQTGWKVKKQQDSVS